MERNDTDFILCSHTHGKNVGLVALTVFQRLKIFTISLERTRTLNPDRKKVSFFSFFKKIQKLKGQRSTRMNFFNTNLLQFENSN